MGSCAPPQEQISSCLDKAALKISSSIHKYPLLAGSFAAAAVGQDEYQEPLKIAKIWLHWDSDLEMNFAYWGLSSALVVNTPLLVPGENGRRRKLCL